MFFEPLEALIWAKSKYTKLLNFNLLNINSTSLNQSEYWISLKLNAEKALKLYPDVKSKFKSVEDVKSWLQSELKVSTREQENKK